ncbi:hypothetical protein BHM03_00013960 [Ensete ventricosum]|nr:hypothetical protein BHM03_00013960 [Ensete ventricosum]
MPICSMYASSSRFASSAKLRQASLHPSPLSNPLLRHSCRFNHCDTDPLHGTGTQLAKAGYAVYGIDYEGHGKSSGLQGFVPVFDELVNDVSDHFTSICERRENKTMMRYLLGESMGGAVALHLHRKKPTFWDGAVSLPFLIVHGGDDSVTDPSVSQSLYESASSDDRSFKLYPGMWHALTSGEPPENIDLVFSDIIAWLDERTIPCSFRTETEHKIGHDPKLQFS